MRIVKRQELCNLPPGTLYMNVYTSPGSAGFSTRGLSVFCAAWREADDGPAFDFVQRSIDTVEASDTADYFDQEQALLDGESRPVQSSMSREGMHDDEAQYLVFEYADIVSILADATTGYPGAAEKAVGLPLGWAQDEADRAERWD